MPRPTGPWKVPEQREREILDAITKGRIRTLDDYASAVLEGGYEDSTTIEVTEQKLADAEQQLAEFLALPNQALALLNNDRNTDRRNRNDVRLKRSTGSRQRLQALLVEAQAFSPPSAAHQDFADYLVSTIETEIAAIEDPDPPIVVPLPQFIARRTAQLEADVSEKRLASETAADVQWVQDLRDSVV